MKATWMLRLFPRAWRARYEEEFRALLEAQPASAGDLLDILMAAGDAQLRYRQLPPATQPVGGYSTPAEIDRRRAERRVRWLTALYANAILFIVTSLVLLGINALTTPDYWWALFPIWGWSMFLVLHAATLVRGYGLLVAHLVLFVALNEGLAGIDFTTDGGPWFHWPLAATAILLLAHALYSFSVTGPLGTHAILYGLSLVLLAATAWVNSDALYALIHVGLGWGVVLLAHALMRFYRLPLLFAHLLVYVGVGSLLIAQDLLEDEGTTWFYYPLLAWAVILAAHAVAESGLIPLFRRDWEAGKRESLSRLAALDGASVADERLPVIVARARQLRLFYLHAFVFAVAATAGVVLNLMTLSSGPWVLWPLWGWGMLFAAHAGYTFARRSLLGAHIALYFLVNAGLIAIDAIYSDGLWFYWPLGATTLLLLVHMVASRDTLHAVRAWQDRRVEALVKSSTDESGGADFPVAG